MIFALSHVILWSFNFNHSFLSGVVSSEAGVKTLWEALAPDLLQESVCELVSVHGRETKNRKRANKAQIVPVVLINGWLSSRGWERQRISLMNTRATLARALSSNKAAQAYRSAVLCVQCGNCSQVTGNNFWANFKTVVLGPRDCLICHYVNLEWMMNWSMAPTSTLCFTRKGLEVSHHGDCINFSQTAS